MKILHLAPIKCSLEDEDLKGGRKSPEGLSASVTSLAEAQFNNGFRVGVISSKDSSRPVKEGIFWDSIGDKTIFELVFNNPLHKILNEFGNFEILNIHDIYNLRQILFLLLSLKEKINIYISPRGCFSEVALSRSRIKKWFFLNLLLRPLLKYIEGFIALNENEKEQIQKVFKNSKVIIISNGIKYSASRNLELKENFQKKVQKKLIKIGYLGRFDIFIKGLDTLLNSYLRYQESSNEVMIELVLIGEHRKREQDSYIFINNFKDKLKDKSKFIVLGPIYGLQKWVELSKFDILIQPSRTEGMPNTVLEAMSIGVPCVISPQTNMADIIQKADCGWVVRSEEKEIEEFFHFVSKFEKKDLVRMGLRGQEYAKDKLTWDKIGSIEYK